MLHRQSCFIYPSFRWLAICALFKSLRQMPSYIVEVTVHSTWGFGILQSIRVVLCGLHYIEWDFRVGLTIRVEPVTSPATNSFCYSPDVWSSGRFVPQDVLSFRMSCPAGRFVSRMLWLRLLCRRMFYLLTFCPSGRYDSGRFVWAPPNTVWVRIISTERSDLSSLPVKTMAANCWPIILRQ